MTTLRGDGSPLEKYSMRQVFSRTLFFLELPEPSGKIRRYAVDVNYDADELSGRQPKEEDSDPDSDSDRKNDSPVALYRDGVQIHRSDLPAIFRLPGGQLEVATTLYGLRRMHFVRDSGEAYVLRPHPHSPEGLRAAFSRRAPRTSRTIGHFAAMILLAGLALTLPQGLETVTDLHLISERIGSFTSPISLPAWANTALVTVTTFAAIERALTLRRHWLLDLGAYSEGESTL